MSELVTLTNQCFDLAVADHKGVYASLAKFTSEHGELAEAVMIGEGDVTHKVATESIFGEIADNYNCLMALLMKLTPNYTNEQRVQVLCEYLAKKNAKWDKVIKQTAKDKALDPVTTEDATTESPLDGLFGQLSTITK